MIDVINKFVGFILNPLSLGIILIAVGLLLLLLKKRVLAACTICATIAWFWFWAMPVVGGWMALPLEEDYPVQLAEEMPTADAIVVMGGGVWGSEEYPYATLKDGADRAWHAARLWKAQKAPVVIPSNKNAEYCDVRFLVDLGVPREAVVLEDKALNTEENAKFVAEILRSTGKDDERKKILLVTSASHMRRSLFMFSKYAPEIECIPAATNYLVLPWKDKPFTWRSFLPDIGALARNNAFMHEYIGYYGYKWFR